MSTHLILPPTGGWRPLSAGEARDEYRNAHAWTDALACELEERLALLGTRNGAAPSDAGDRLCADLGATLAQVQGIALKLQAFALDRRLYGVAITREGRIVAQDGGPQAAEGAGQQGIKVNVDTLHTNLPAA